MRRIAGLALLVLAGCEGGGQPTDDGLRHEFEAISVDAGEEIESLCQSWTLNNEEELWIAGVEESNEGGLHHSNWYWVPENVYAGPDGTWPCSQRGFDAIGAGLLGGILFAQSTQSREDVMTLVPGAAQRIGERARIIGEIHVLNATPAPMSTRVSLTLAPIAAADVTARMSIMGVLYEALEIRPRGRSEFVAECDLGELYEEKLGRAPDFSVYYGLAHYHGLGVGARAELVGGTRDGEVIFDTSARAGDSLAVAYPTPVSVAGATGLRVSCTYDNPRDQTVSWGFGDQEMCGVGFYTDSPLRLAAAVTESEYAGESDAVHENHGACRFLSVPAL